jgi:hypothetical protein
LSNKFFELFEMAGRKSEEFRNSVRYKQYDFHYETQGDVSFLIFKSFDFRTFKSWTCLFKMTTGRRLSLKLLGFLSTTRQQICKIVRRESFAQIVWTASTGPM